MNTEKPKVLVVDDVRDYTLMLKAYFSTLSIEAVCAANGKEAIEKIDGNKPVMIFTDTNMPEMDGIQLLRWVQTNHPEIPVVIFYSESSLHYLINEKDLLQIGAYRVLSKPYDFKEIGSIIESLVLK